MHNYITEIKIAQKLNITCHEFRVMRNYGSNKDAWPPYIDAD